MKTNSKILALSLSALLAFSGNAFAQQQKQQKQQQTKKVENVKSKTSYKTEYFYYTDSKLSLSAVKKKLIKMPGVKNVSYSTKNKRFQITYDSQKAPQATIKKNMKGWGTPGDFNKPQTKSSKKTAPNKKK